MEAEDDALALLAEAGDGSMRDALSIMDQAIASAPVEAGRPVLSAAQIRELMGSVPNAVFERLLEAVAAGQSAGADGAVEPAGECRAQPLVAGPPDGSLPAQYA